MNRALLNFSGHALSETTLRELSNRFSRIETIPFDAIHFELSVEEQLQKIIQHVKTPLDGSVPITIILPGQATFAVLLFVYLNGLVGSYPALCLLEVRDSGEYGPSSIFDIDAHKLRLEGRAIRQNILRNNNSDKN